MSNRVLIIGSAPDAVRALSIDASVFSAIVVLNNAWRIRDDWTHIVYPEDFAEDRRPPPIVGKTVVQYDQFVPANNAFGGTVYAGGTMAFTGAYWVLHALKPSLMAFIGCDMIYDGDPGKSHFYGRGEADPLRDDPTLQHLESKSDRLMWKAFENQCLCVNLSNLSRSRLTFEAVEMDVLSNNPTAVYDQGMGRLQRLADMAAADRALQMEGHAGAFVESGDYWNSSNPLDPEQLSAIDQQWGRVFSASAAE